MSAPPGAPFTAYIGALLEEKRAGYARLSLTTGAEHADVFGRVHSGVLTSVMASVIGISLGQLRGQDAREREGPHATIEMSTSFYAWATPGDDIIAEGRVTHMTERVAFGEVEAKRVSDGEVLAKARLTFALPGRSTSGQAESLTPEVQEESLTPEVQEGRDRGTKKGVE